MTQTHRRSDHGGINNGRIKNHRTTRNTETLTSGSTGNLNFTTPNTTDPLQTHILSCHSNTHLRGLSITDSLSLISQK
jgi:hypothetical protein